MSHQVSRGMSLAAWPLMLLARTRYPNLVPRVGKREIPGATISGMHHRSTLCSDPGEQNSIVSFVISKWFLPTFLSELSFQDRWSRGTKTLGTEYTPTSYAG